MSISFACKGCKTVITAQDGHELVAALQRHIVDDHNSSHSPTREQILAILHRQGGDSQ
jgi:predicted small metal-binding protein